MLQKISAQMRLIFKTWIFGTDRPIFEFSGFIPLKVLPFGSMIVYTKY